MYCPIYSLLMLTHHSLASCHTSRNRTVSTISIQICHCMLTAVSAQRTEQAASSLPRQRCGPWHSKSSIVRRATLATPGLRTATKRSTNDGSLLPRKSNSQAAKQESDKASRRPWRGRRGPMYSKMRGRMPASMEVARGWMLSL